MNHSPIFRRNERIFKKPADKVIFLIDKPSEFLLRLTAWRLSSHAFCEMLSDTDRTKASQEICDRYGCDESEVPSHINDCPFMICMRPVLTKSRTAWHRMFWKMGELESTCEDINQLYNDASRSLKGRKKNTKNGIQITLKPLRMKIYSLMDSV